MSEEVKVLKNRFAVVKYLHAQGYDVARGTVYKFLNNGEIKPTAPGGGWLPRAVENYASAKWTKEGDAKSKPSKAVQASLVSDSGAGLSAAEERAREDARLKRMQADLAEIRKAEKQGSFVPREIVERDLALRAQAFRYGLENFIHDALGEIAAMFGGEERTAREIVRLVGGDESKAGEIVRRVQQREPELVAMWVDQVERFLEPYAEGSWWDDELARIMETAPKTDGGMDAGSDSGE